MLKFITGLICAVLMTTFTAGYIRAAEQDVMIVLDASGSMWGQIDGVTKIEIARDVMGRVLTDLDAKANIGVITYGHRKKGDCSDIETIIPVGKVNRGRYMAAINALTPKGKTPISDAVRKAAEELRFTEDKATVVLVSDGLETCDADPCALAKELETKGIDFTVHVVGFDLKDKDTSSLQCLAAETGGKYLEADNADQLGDAVGTVVAQAPEATQEPVPEPAKEPTLLKVNVRLAAEADPVDSAYIRVFPETNGQKSTKAAVSGTGRNPFKVKPGKYYLEAKVGSVAGSAETVVEKNKENSAEIILNAGYLSVKAVQEEGAEPISQAYIRVAELDVQANGKRKRIAAGNQRQIFIIAAGKYLATATHGKASASQEVEVQAGERTDIVILLASGILKIDVLAEEGGKPQKQAYVTVYEDEAGVDGKRKRVTAGDHRKKFSLPAGTYYVVAKVGNAEAGKQIEVAAGKLKQDQIVLGFGAMKATVIPIEGGKPLKKAYITIQELEKQLDGKRSQITAGNQNKTFKLPAGKYLVTAKLDKAVASSEIEIVAGKRIEPVIDLNAGALSVTSGKKNNVINVYFAEKNLDGSKQLIASFRARKPFMLSAGKYIISGKEDGELIEVEAEIKAGKLTEIKLIP